MNITITGPRSVGKTTISKLIAKKLKLKYISSDEIGEKEFKNFSKDYEPNAKWFFIDDKNKIVAFGCLRQIKINYLGKNYNILEICSAVSIIKGKGIGKKLAFTLENYFKKNKAKYFSINTNPKSRTYKMYLKSGFHKSKILFVWGRDYETD